NGEFKGRTTGTDPNLKNAKAVLEAAGALMKYIKEAPKKWGGNLGKKVQGEIKALVDQVAYGTGSKGGYSIVKMLQDLVLKGQPDYKEYEGALNTWLKSPDNSKSINAFLGKFATVLYDAKLSSSSKVLLTDGVETLIQQCSTFNTVIKDRAARNSATLEAIYSGEAKIIKKWFDTIQMMMSLFTSK
ncbi:hypothetical protein LCGC14_3096190, partial [marine sediment metagenome]